MRIASPRSLLVLLSVAACAALPRSAQAAWPNSAYTGLPVCVVNGEQELCTAVADGAGGVILVWQDTRFGTTFDIFGEHVLPSGAVDPVWPALGLSICTSGATKLDPIAISDGAGGAIVAWIDGRNAGNGWDLFAQHVMASGVVDPAWPASGRELCTAAGDQINPVLVSDGAGGAIAAWEDNRPSASGAYDIYAQHVQANGVLDPIWPVNGQAICTAAGLQTNATIASDGFDGAIITWADHRGASYDIYAAHVFVTSLVDVAYPANGLAVCTASGDQVWPVVVSDGDHGAIIAWHDRRNGTDYNIYAQHVVQAGTIDPGWLGNGNVLGAAAGDDEYPVIASDGVGGAFVAWMNLGLAANWKVLVQHVLPTGALDTGWPANGLAASAATGDQKNPMIVADGLGGAFLAWQDLRAVTNWDIYGQHVLPGVGLDATFWPTNGKAVSAAAGNQFSEGTFGTAYCSLASDGAGGLIAAWHDFRASSLSDIYAERVARFGYIGTPEAEIVGVSDVPNDQGGKVKLSWNASYLDQSSDPNLAAYDVLRSVPTALALARVQRGARLVGTLADLTGAGASQMLVTRDGAQSDYWEYVASVSALHYVSGYSYLAPTTGDSTGAGNPLTAFMVVARNANGSVYWPSSPRSGYSVDNLPPAAPAPFTATFASGATHLMWGANSEPDLAGYRLYRGNSAEFVPGPASLIASPSETAFSDVGPAGSWYKLSAVDVHGNESLFAVVGPTTTADVGGAIPTVLAFAPAAPNPAAGSTTLRFGLPRAARVGLAIYDASGRRIRTLVSCDEPAGDHEIVWDLRDDAGRALGAGLYFARLEVGGRLLSHRLAVLR